MGMVSVCDRIRPRINLFGHELNYIRSSSIPNLVSTREFYEFCAPCRYFFKDSWQGLANWVATQFRDYFMKFWVIYQACSTLRQTIEK